MIRHVALLPSIDLETTRKIFGVDRTSILREQVASGQTDMKALERLKVLINSSTPIVVMETVEEVRAMTLVSAACAELNMALFEWTVADGLIRSGSKAPAAPVADLQMRINAARHGTDPGAPDSSKAAIYNTADPVQALANLEAMTLEAVFVLKDFHRHMDNPVVVRRLRDVGQKFSANRRTLGLNAPAIEKPPELASLVEFLDLPLPDRDRLREIIRETYTRLTANHTLKHQLDPNGVDAHTGNLRRQ